MTRKKAKYRFSYINVHKFRLKHKIFAFFLFSFLLIFLYFKFIATPVVIKNTKTQLAYSATKSINLAIAETMNQYINYGDLIKIERDANGNVLYFEANSIKINLLSKNMSKIVLTNFVEQSKFPIVISLGAFSGIAILTEVGPKIACSVKPYGEVLCFFKSCFEEAGINQTYHKIYLSIMLTVNVVFPLKVMSFDRSSEVLLCETLIVGKIPDVYLNSNSLPEMVDMIPEKYGN